MRAVLTVAAVMIAARPVAADPMESRVLTAPPAGAATATLGIDHRGDTAAYVAASLDGLAELEIDEDSDVRGCTDCAMQRTPLRLGRAAFRIGVHQDWLHGMPALVLGVRTTFAAYDPAVGAPRATDAYLVASRDLGVVRLHAGVDALAASVGDHRSAAALRPLGGVELHPPMYPRSSLLGDIAWEPELDAAQGPVLRWMLGVGVRYQAFSWASVELAVRARQGDDLGGATVMARFNVIARR
jgi:hypothetical protein